MRKTYLILLIVIMMISLGFTFRLPIEDIWPVSNVLFLIIIIVDMIGLIKLKDHYSKGLLLLSSFYYTLRLLMTMTGKVDSLLLLIPLTLIPILTTKILNHIGLANRMALSFWFVFACLMVKTNLPALSFAMWTAIVFCSYFLEMTSIFFNESESYGATDMFWEKPGSTRSNLDDHNATYFNRKH